jgi:cardiolipin synthase
MFHNKKHPQLLAPLPLWETEQVFFCGEDWLNNLLSDIKSAQKSIQLQTYIFELDTVGIPILNALCAASAQGIKVCVIVDGIGSFGAIKPIQKALQNHGAELAVYHPLPWCLSTGQLRRAAWISHILMRWTSINKRQHSKLCLVDGYIAWVGSFNITDKHIFRANADNNWIDAVARVTGGRCVLLGEFFSAVWTHNIHKLSAYFLRYPITNYSRVLRKKRLKKLLESMSCATQRIWIESAYFSPTDVLIRALKAAAVRGIDVHIIVSKKSDVPFFPALSSTYYMDLLHAGVHIHAYSKGILHTKYMVIDERLVIGSSNMNHRSLLHDIELDIELFKPSSIESIENHFQEMVQNSKEITAENISKRYARLVMLGQIPRLLRYWL